MTEPNKRPGIGDGIRTGLGVLNAFKDALDETLQEAVARGDLSAERARQAVQDVVSNAQARLDQARERVELVPRRDFEALREEVEALRRRVDAMEAERGTAAPE